MLPSPQRASEALLTATPVVHPLLGEQPLAGVTLHCTATDPAQGPLTLLWLDQDSSARALVSDLSKSVSRGQESSGASSVTNRETV